jgi:hypothetical protein
MKIFGSFETSGTTCLIEAPSFFNSTSVESPKQCVLVKHEYKDRTNIQRVHGRQRYPSGNIMWIRINRQCSISQQGGGVGGFWHQLGWAAYQEAISWQRDACQRFACYEFHKDRRTVLDSVLYKIKNCLVFCEHTLQGVSKKNYLEAKALEWQSDSGICTVRCFHQILLQERDGRGM